jgi:fibronectin-binding autotransporter adhesin
MMSCNRFKGSLLACSTVLGIAMACGNADANLYVDCVDATTGSNVEVVSSTSGSEAFTLDVYAVVIDPSGSYNTADAFNTLFATFQTTSGALKGDVSLVSINTGGSPNYLFTKTTYTKSGLSFTAGNATVGLGGTSPTDNSTSGNSNWFSAATNLGNFYTVSSAPATAQATYVNASGGTLASSAGAAGCEFLLGQIKVDFSPYQSSWGALGPPLTTTLSITSKSTGPDYVWASSAAPKGQAAAGSSAAPSGETAGPGPAGNFNLALQPMTFMLAGTYATTYNLTASESSNLVHSGGTTSVTATITNAGGSQADALNYSGLNLNPSAGLLSGAGLPANGGPLARQSSGSGGQIFTATAPGFILLTPSASSATNATLLTPASPGTITSGTISVFSGNAIWTGTAGNSWNTNANFNDLNAAGIHAAPGVFAGFNDSLVLNDSSGNRTLSLNGATPNLSSLTIGTTSGSGYVLGQGTGGSLVMNNGANSASINVSAGQQTISAPVSLASALNVNFSGAAASLVLSGGLSETAPGQGLTISGGQLTLSGTSSYTGGTTVSQGTLNVAGAMLGGGNVVLAGNAVLSGSGVVRGNISGAAASTINATASLILGDSTSYTGFNQAGTLAVGPNLVTLNSAGVANLGILTTISGGTINAANGISLGGGCNLVGAGTVKGAVAAGYGSTISATGNLTLGDGAAYNGFLSTGRLYTNANTVTLNSGTAANSLNAVVLGTLTQINGGSLVAPNGFLLSNGCNLVTNDSGGTVSGGPASRFLNDGNVQGPSSSSSNWLVFNDLFKGSTGQTSGRIAFLGGFQTGDCPGVNTQYGATILGGSGTIFDVGGTTPGDSDNNYGQLNVLAGAGGLSGPSDLVLNPGTSFNIVDWNGFAPHPGESFTVLNWDGTLSGTATLSVDPAFAAEGITFVPQWNSNSLVLTAVPEPTTLALFASAAIGLLGCGWRRWHALTRRGHQVPMVGVGVAPCSHVLARETCLRGNAALRHATHATHATPCDNADVILRPMRMQSVSQEMGMPRSHFECGPSGMRPTPIPGYP